MSRILVLYHKPPVRRVAESLNHASCISSRVVKQRCRSTTDLSVRHLGEVGDRYRRQSRLGDQDVAGKPSRAPSVNLLQMSIGLIWAEYGWHDPLSHAKKKTEPKVRCPLHKPLLARTKQPLHLEHQGRTG